MTRHWTFSAFLKRTPRSALMSMACAALVLLLAACSGSTTGNTGTTGTTTGSGVGLSGGTDISGKTVLFEIQSTPSDSFFVPVVNGAKAAAAIAGLKLQIQYASNDDTTEVNQVNTAMASNVIGVALSIPDAGLNKVVCDARSKGIAVVAFNIDGATGQGASCVQAFVGQDFVLSGELIAQDMINAGQIKAGDHVFCPVEFPAQVYAAERYQGVKQALSAIGATCDELGTGVDFGPAKATMVSYLLGHPNTSAIIGLGHTPLDQAPAAVKQVGKNIPIGGFDVTSDILSSIKSGAITATVDQQPYIQGYQSVMQLALYLKYAISPANINTSTGALIDKNNVDKVVSLVPNYR
jgi:simple sugar transport system substrate-binding protein